MIVIGSIIAVFAFIMALIVIIIPKVTESKEIKIPDVYGMEISKAEDMLKKAGFKIESKSKSSDEVDENLVIETEPTKNRYAKKGSTVTIYYSSGTKKIEIEEEEDQLSHELNEKQKKYFASCLEYYADKGHGAEDDCSLAAIYDLTRPVPEVRIPNEEAIKLWDRTMQERNEVVRDYENRKSGLLASMAHVYGSTSFKGGGAMDQWMETHERFEEQKRTLKTIVINENEKIAFYERQLSFYSQYIEGGVEENSASKKLLPHQVDESLMLPDEEFLRLKNLRQDYKKKMATYKQNKNDLEDTARAIDNAYDEAKRLAKLNGTDADTTDTLIRSAREKHQNTKEAYEKAIL